jgi:hypothetical protein
LTAGAVGVGGVVSCGVLDGIVNTSLAPEASPKRDSEEAPLAGLTSSMLGIGIGGG